MFKLIKMAAIAAITSVALSAGTVTVNAEEPLNLASLNLSLEQYVEPKEIPNQSTPIRVANACGLCTDEDCCGGTENGWKLCKADCPEGQYKCEQVSLCD